MTRLDNPAELARRRALRGEAHMRSLAEFAADLRRSTGGYVPDADPCDGGIASRALLLLETPGPSIRATGFVSRDNPTATARNITRFATEGGLARADTLIWNTVPWTIHSLAARNRAPQPAEIRDGLAALPAFLSRVPALRCVILAGRVAACAREVLCALRPGLVVFTVPHPSPTIVCTSPAVGARIRDGFAAAAALLRTDHA